MLDGFTATAFCHLLKEFSHLEEQHHKDSLRELGFGPWHKADGKGAKGGDTHEEILAECLSVKKSLGRFLQGVKAHDEVWHKENEKVLPRSPGRGVPFNEPGRNKKHRGHYDLNEAAVALLFLMVVMMMLVTAVEIVFVVTVMVLSVGFVPGCKCHRSCGIAIKLLYL